MQKFTLRSEADNGVVIEYSFESEYLPGVQEQVQKISAELRQIGRAHV